MHGLLITALILWVIYSMARNARQSPKATVWSPAAIKAMNRECNRSILAGVLTLAIAVAACTLFVVISELF